MPIPNQTINIKDPGLGIVEAAPTAPLILGTSELGTAFSLLSFSRKNDVVAVLGQGPLSECLCKVLDVAGGPALAMKLPSSVAPTLGAVTATRIGSSTGTITVAISQNQASRVYQVDATPMDVFVEDTADFASATAADVDPFPTTEAITDYFAIGYTAPFRQLSVVVSTSGTVGVVAWEYWNGIAWVALTGLTDGTANFTVAPGSATVSFTLPSDWVARSLNSTEPLYYIRARITTVYTINPVLTSGRIEGHGAFDRYEVAIEVLKTGTLGAGTFRYSLDNEVSFSAELVIPGGGSFAIPGVGITLTFVPGAGPTFYQDGDFYRFTTTEPSYSTANVQTAVTALLALATEYPFIALTGTPATASAGVTMFSALDTHASTYQTNKRFLAFVMDAGSDDTVVNIQTSYAAVSSRRVMPVYGRTTVVSSKPLEGFSAPRRSGMEIVAAFAAAQLISTDLARVALGPLPGVQATTHDESLNEQLDAHGITTFRTHTGRSGIYITNGRIKAPAGSDFRFWQFRRVMDVACRRVFIEQQNFLNVSVRTIAGTGFIDERDASRLESIVREALRIDLSRPVSAEGTPGHVSSVGYAINRTNNIAQSLTLQSEVAIRPLGYAKTIVTEIGYSLGEAA